MHHENLNQGFQITILKQGWLPDGPPEKDLCSHGFIDLIIGGQRISIDGKEYGINESALALLRTVEGDHSLESPVCERLILHGCGAILMTGCPIGIDWSVKHLGAKVRMGDIVRYDTPDEAKAIRFPEVDVEVRQEHYRRQVCLFAQKAKSLFDNARKVFVDDFDREQYEMFWDEYNQLLSRFE